MVITTANRQLQKAVLKKYREQGVLPSIQQTARETNLSTGTVFLFFEGNSINLKLIEYCRRKINHHNNNDGVDESTKALMYFWDKI